MMLHLGESKHDSDFRNLISESVISSPRKSSLEASPPSTLSPSPRSPSKKGEQLTFLPQQQYVRLPISLSLLHSISQLKHEPKHDLYLFLW